MCARWHLSIIKANSVDMNATHNHNYTLMVIVGYEKRLNCVTEQWEINLQGQRALLSG